jgi:photosystem II stability/assembly factor-like uncharacterized protein
VILFNKISLAASIVLAACLGCVCQAQDVADHVQLAPKPVADVFFVNRDNGFAIESLTNSCVLWKTNKDALDWKSIAVPCGAYKVYFTSPLVGWVLVFNKHERTTELYSTADGGSHWVSQSKVASFPEVISDFLMSPNGEGWFAGNSRKGSGFLGHLRPGESMAHNQIEVQARRIHRILRASDGKLWLLTDTGLYLSSDNGARFDKVAFSSEDKSDTASLSKNLGVRSAHLIGERIYFSGYKQIFTSRTGSSAKLRITEISTPFAVNSFAFWDSENGCAIGSSNAVLCTGDHGEHWQVQSYLPKALPPQEDNFSKLIMLDSGVGYALRSGGYLYVTRDFGKSWTTALD